MGRRRCAGRWMRGGEARTDAFTRPTAVGCQRLLPGIATRYKRQPSPAAQAGMDIDMHHCPNRGGAELTIIATLLARPVVEKTLTQLGLDPQPLPSTDIRPHLSVVEGGMVLCPPRTSASAAFRRWRSCGAGKKSCRCTAGRADRAVRGRLNGPSRRLRRGQWLIQSGSISPTSPTGKSAIACLGLISR
jgi:hypothetical protein